MTVAVDAMHLYIDTNFSGQIRIVEEGGLRYHSSHTREQKNLETVQVFKVISASITNTNNNNCFFKLLMHIFQLKFTNTNLSGYR